MAPSFSPPLLISAPAKSSGKTTVAIGLTRALVNRGLKVQTFKKGPDYIDPMWHSLASGRPGRNLDTWMMPEALWQGSLARHSQGMDFTLIEGNHGLHDGLDLEGRHSSAGLAQQLGAPVLLVVDGSGMNRGAAALVLGQLTMQPKVQIAGVVLNRIRSQRQADKQIQAIAHHTGVPVFGVLPSLPGAGVEQRHLGLSTTGETSEAEKIVQAAAALMNSELDLDKIKAAVSQASPLSFAVPPTPKRASQRHLVGVLRNQAFCFFYPENLEALEQAGAELVFLDPCTDTEIPDIQGLYIGGGFPEHFLEPLSRNSAFKEQLKTRLCGGLPYWAECGGLIYLAEAASFAGQESVDLVGWLDGSVEFSRRPVGYGYMELEGTGDHWFSGKHQAHEFHYSKLNSPAALDCQFQVHRGYGLGEQQDGLLKGAGIASYAHVHALSSPDWAPGFLQQISQYALR